MPILKSQIRHIYIIETILVREILDNNVSSPPPPQLWPTCGIFDVFFTIPPSDINVLFATPPFDIDAFLDQTPMLSNYLVANYLNTPSVVAEMLHTYKNTRTSIRTHIALKKLTCLNKIGLSPDQLDILRKIDQARKIPVIDWSLTADGPLWHTFIDKVKWHGYLIRKK